MELGLTNEQKITSLNSQKTGIQQEIYTLLVRMNIDPDDFNPTVPLEPNDSFIGELSRVSSLLEALTLIERKLTELL